jgi:hypothetical protein
MGIDVVIKWRGKNEEVNFQKQFDHMVKWMISHGVTDEDRTSENRYNFVKKMTGAKSTMGHLGVLREAYHTNVIPEGTYGNVLLSDYIDTVTFTPESEYNNLRHHRAIDQALELQHREKDSMPYALRHLFFEAWTNDECICRITSSELKSRLTVAKHITRTRYKILNYNLELLEANIQSLEDFVNLYEEKEKAGLEPFILVSY